MGIGGGMTDLADLISAWETSPYPSIKTSSYFPVYALLLGKFRLKEVTIVETGVLGGGSLFMWRKWLGSKARIIGIDLNPEAKKWEEHGFEIYIGDQGDRNFWREVLPRIGKVDIFLDDGGHQSFQQIVTVQELIKYVHHECLIIVEDTYTSFMNDFKSHEENSFLEYAKDSTDVLVGRSFDLYPNRFPSNFNSEQVTNFKDVFNISFFNGIVVFHISPENCPDAVVVRNRIGQPVKDFRYEGQKSAIVGWPHILKTRLVEIKGG